MPNGPCFALKNYIRINANWHWKLCGNRHQHWLFEPATTNLSNCQSTLYILIWTTSVSQQNNPHMEQYTCLISTLDLWHFKRNFWLNGITRQILKITNEASVIFFNIFYYFRFYLKRRTVQFYFIAIKNKPLIWIVMAWSFLRHNVYDWTTQILKNSFLLEFHCVWQINKYN